MAGIENLCVRIENPMCKSGIHRFFYLLLGYAKKETTLTEKTLRS